MNGEQVRIHNEVIITCLMVLIGHSSGKIEESLSVSDMQAENRTWDLSNRTLTIQPQAMLGKKILMRHNEVLLRN
jgi:hypothetical protein